MCCFICESRSLSLCCRSDKRVGAMATVALGRTEREEMRWSAALSSLMLGIKRLNEGAQRLITERPPCLNVWGGLTPNWGTKVAQATMYRKSGSATVVTKMLCGLLRCSNVSKYVFSSQSICRCLRRKSQNILVGLCCNAEFVQLISYNLIIQRATVTRNCTSTVMTFPMSPIMDTLFKD